MHFFTSKKEAFQAIKKAKDADQVGPEVLFQSCQQNWPDVLEKLLKKYPHMGRVGEGYYWRMAAQYNHVQVLEVFLKHDPDPKEFLKSIQYAPLFDAGLKEQNESVVVLAPYVSDQMLWRATNQYLKSFDEVFAQLPHKRQQTLADWVDEATRQKYAHKMPKFGVFLEREHLKEATQYHSLPSSKSRKL